MNQFEHDLESYNQLGMDEQMRIIRKVASKTESLEDENNRIDLYSYCDFFIELTFRKELNIIKKIQAISALDYADKYIELEDMKDF